MAKFHIMLALHYKWQGEAFAKEYVVFMSFHCFFGGNLLFYFSNFPFLYSWHSTHPAFFTPLQF